MLNPDGYHFSWTGDRYWRKNRNPNNGHKCKGVDLNRNYDIEWMNAGTSTNPCSSTYGGKSAFSEPESQAHRDHMLSIPNKKAYLTYHAYSEFIIYPYSSSFEKEAWNKMELDTMAQEMQQAIATKYQHTYEYGEGAIAFYPASGGSDDWAHSIGVPLSFTIELRDTGSYGFILPENQILPTCIENMEGIRTVYKHVRPENNCENGCDENSECIFVEDSMQCSCLEAFISPQTGECLSDKGKFLTTVDPPPLGLESASLQFSLSIFLNIYILFKNCMKYL